MSTVGVPACTPWRVDALRFPSYNDHYYAFKRKQAQDHRDAVLAQPSPIYRRTTMDFLRKEQQRREDANSAKPGSTKRDVRQWLASGEGAPADSSTQALLPIVPAPPVPDLMVRARLPPTEYARWRHDTTPVVTTQTRLEWNSFLSRCPERYHINLPKYTDNCETYYDTGYAMRYLDPFTTRGMGNECEHHTYLNTVPGPSLPSPYRTVKFLYQPVQYNKTLLV